jgi:hypothetical protein
MLVCGDFKADPLSRGVVLDLRALKGRFVETGVFIGNASSNIDGLFQA